MNLMKLMRVIKAPIISEKASSSGSQVYQQIVFRVNKGSTKMEVKQAVEYLFSVEVMNVNTVNIKGKKKKYHQRLGCKNDMKKAYVTLKKGFQIGLTSP